MFPNDITNSPSPGQEDPEPTQITEEQKELRTSQEEEQLQRLRSATTEVVQLIFIPRCVESDCDQDSKTDSLPSNTTEQTQSALDDEDYRASQLSSHSQLLSALNPHCSAALSEIIVSIDEDESEELPSRSKRTREKKKQISQVWKKSSNQSERESYLCSDCGKSFRTISYLRVHMKTHRERELHKCPVCGKCFTSSAYFKLHQRIHTGEKQHQCNVCSKSFTLSGHLTEHMRTHTGEKSFKCPVCGKSFTSSSVLKRHQQNHCGKTAKEKQSEETSYLCSDCGKSFRTMSYLRVSEYSSLQVQE
uniref:C2H2-type domain-containing protein n=1 Tax=Oncorhynchus tshawytscha TaxID=74940 RepID=A0AAZ3QFM2_ONCTS